MRGLAAGRLTATAPGLADAHAVVELQVAALVLAHAAALYVAHLRAVGVWVVSTVALVMPDDVLPPVH